MKVQYASDLHLEFADNWRFLRENPLQITGDILVLAGDIGYLGDQNYRNHPFWDWASENYNQVLVVLGNHEFYKYYDLSTMTDGLIGEIRPNVHYYYNKVVRIEETDFILSTLWSRIDKVNAPYTEQCVTDFHRIMHGKNILTYHEFNQEHDRCFKFIERAVEEKLASQLCKGNREIARKFRLDKIEYLPESRYRDIYLELQDKNGTPWDDLTNDQKKMFIEFVEGSATKWRRRSGLHMAL